MVDRKEFDETFQYYDRETVLEIIDIFEKELPGRLSAIRKNIIDEDFSTLAFNVHSLKGVIALFLAAEPTGIASKLEEQAIARNSESLLLLYTSLATSTEMLMVELNEIRKEYSS
jgi:HPt (histidine-containing phosphotransfer) domain-containing protein